MENIDPVYFLGPVAIIAMSVALTALWHRRRRLTWWALLFSACAYLGAIGVKALLQAVTYGPFSSAVHGSSWATGAYYGLQTVFLEVGLAYVFARYAASHGLFGAGDAEGYGISLAFWENGLLVGGIAALQYAAYYTTLAGAGASAQQLLSTLLRDAPSLFYPPARALPLVGYSVLERVSSLLLHFSWGYLCVLAAVFRRRVFLYVALPMGLADVLIVFEPSLGVPAFEGVLFIIGLASLVVAMGATRGSYRKQSTDFAPHPKPGAVDLRLLFTTNFKRALSFGKVYVVMGMVLPLLLVAEFAAGSAAAAGTEGVAFLWELFPLLMPVFVVLGATGGLMIFSSDREKGVYEYMIAYGVDVSTIFLSIVVATAGLVTLVLAVSLVVSMVSLVVVGATISFVLVELLLLYTIPLSYASAVFMAMVGMVWSQLTSRRPGVNSPVGVAPMLGIVPVFLTLILAIGPGAGYILYVVGGTSIAMVWAVIAMAWVANKKMERERFISNA